MHPNSGLIESKFDVDMEFFIVNDRSIKVSYTKHAFYRCLSIKKHFVFNLSNSPLLYQKTNGISKTQNLIIFKKSGHLMGLSQKYCFLGLKLAKKDQLIAGFFSEVFVHIS